MHAHLKRADQQGHTLSELIIASAVAMIFVPTIIGIFIVALGLLKYTDRAPTEVSYAVTGELSRAAALIVPQQSCVNPQSVNHYEDCVEAENSPLVPFENKANDPTTLSNSDSPDTLCWLALSNTDRHTRVKQCWTHDPATKQINISLYSPSAANSQDLLKIEAWRSNPDSTTSAATGIEAWAWELHKEDLLDDHLEDVVLVQIDICASLTDEERGRAHLAGLPRCDARPDGTELLFEAHPGCLLPTDSADSPCVGVQLPSIFLAPGVA